MSIELYEAKRKLDIFEKGVNNPEIFMSTSFVDIFLLQVGCYRR